MTFWITISSANASREQSITENRLEFMYCLKAESSDATTLYMSPVTAELFNDIDCSLAGTPKVLLKTEWILEPEMMLNSEE